MEGHHLIAALSAVATAAACAMGIRAYLRGGTRRRGPAGSITSAERTSRWFAVVAIGLAGWSFATLVSVLSTDPNVKLSVITVKVTLMTVVPFSLWWWAMRVTGWRQAFGRGLPLLIALPGVGPALWMWFGDPGQLMFTSLDAPSDHRPVHYELGALGVIHIAWVYLMSGLAFASFLWLAQAVPRRLRRWGYVTAASFSLPVAANIVTIAGLPDSAGHDTTVVGMTVMIFTLWVGTERLHVVDHSIAVLPIARDEVVESMSEGVVVLDDSARLLDLNPAGAAILAIDGHGGAVADDVLPGWSDRQPEQQTWEFSAPGADPPRVIEARVESLGTRRDNTGTLVLLRDITRQRNAQAALERSVAQHVHASRHDPLTGLPNRVLLFSELRSALSPSGNGCALFILDLNGFKGLNDTFGHRSGDRVLRDLAGRLEVALEKDVLIARLGGDEFAVLAPHADGDGLAALAERVLGAFRAPFRVATTDVQISCSVGVALGPEHGRDADDLVHAADVAMYHAKRSSSRWAAYEPGLDARRPEQLILRHDLQRALGASELVLHFQPLAAPNGRISGAEALVRWQHPARGLLMPDQFLPVIEDTELIRHLTDTVMDLALAQLRRWGDPEFRVAVNLSSLDMRDRDLPDRVAAALERHGVEPRLLTLEISENALWGSGLGEAQLDRLREGGVRVALDDFGTGMAPLSSLRDLPVDELKIDRSFVHAMADDPRDAALVGGLIRLGHDLGLTVVAEGVETRGEAALLGGLGCDLLQGYLIGRPAEAGDEPPTSADADTRDA